MKVKIKNSHTFWGRIGIVKAKVYDTHIIRHKKTKVIDYIIQFKDPMEWSYFHRNEFEIII